MTTQISGDTGISQGQAPFKIQSVTTTQKNAIASPAAGMLVFDSTLSKLCVYTGAAWQTVTSA